MNVTEAQTIAREDAAQERGVAERTSMTAHIPPGLLGDSSTLGVNQAERALELMVELMGETRGFRREAREVAERIRQDADAAEVDALRDKADDLLTGAWISGAMQFASAAARGLELSQHVTALDTGPVATDAATATAKFWGAVGEILLRGSQVPEQVANSAAAASDADARAAASLAETARAQTDTESDALREAGDLAERMLGALRAVAEARDSGLRAIYRA